MIQTYYGNGKGKTSASVGAAIRFAGSGQKVLYVQCLKNGDSSELNLLRQIEAIRLILPEENYQLYDNLREKRYVCHREAYQKLLQTVEHALSESFSMIVLDEILDVVSFGYLTEKELVEALLRWTKTCELVLTGHTLPEQIQAISDYISEVKAVRHPYCKGVLPRIGIEY